MSSHQHDIPHPDLRIVPTLQLHPHEEHDDQRSGPLAERLRTETTMINPPLVTPFEDGFVVLDGANRYHAFRELDIPHILVQVVDYASSWVDLSTWHHIVGSWSAEALLESASRIDGAHLLEGTHAGALADVLTRDGRRVSLVSEGGNRALRTFVIGYQRQASLHRTTLHDYTQLWHLYPDAVALVRFPAVTPEHVLYAARTLDYLPPGVSRHIVHGRAVRINYPLAALRDRQTSLEAKNAALLEWTRERLANRRVRFYAEGTYQYDE